MPDPDLEAAYVATDYRVDDGPYGPLVIRIGEPCPDADRLLTLHGRTEWTFITAWNPGSKPLAPAENARRMVELEAVCLDRGWTHYIGAGISRDGTWPPELSFLVVGPTAADAEEVARHFRQNAIVVGRVGELARLVWVT